MAVKIRKLRRQDVEGGVPYLTTSNVKTTGLVCNDCNLPFETGQVRAVVEHHGTITLFCGACMLDAMVQLKTAFQKALNDLNRLDLAKPFSRDYKNEVSGSGLPISVATREETLTYEFLAPHQAKTANSSNSIEQPCLLCKSKLTHRGVRGTKSYWGGKQSVSLPASIDYTSYIYIQRDRGYADRSSYCRDCAVEFVEYYVSCYEEMVAAIPALIDQTRKFEHLTFPTTGTLFKEESVHLQNIERQNTCKKCEQKVERTCLKVSDTDMPELNNLCMKCGSDVLEEKIRLYTKTLETMSQFRAERCVTCPHEVRVKCLTKGIAVPAEALLAGCPD